MPSRETIDLAPPVEKAFLLAVDTGDDPGWNAEDSLTELAALATTAGADVVGAEWQNRRHVDPNWYVGKGKAEELLQAKSETGFDILIADDELSPAQQKSLESLLNTKVIDRSRLILDIFALHAQTHEGRLQVELAQLEYQLPRLTRLWTHLSRTQGGIGSRGPGETQLETDRRIIRNRIKKMHAAPRCSVMWGRAAPPIGTCACSTTCSISTRSGSIRAGRKAATPLRPGFPPISASRCGRRPIGGLASKAPTSSSRRRGRMRLRRC